MCSKIIKQLLLASNPVAAYYFVGKYHVLTIILHDFSRHFCFHRIHSSRASTFLYSFSRSSICAVKRKNAVSLRQLYSTNVFDRFITLSRWFKKFCISLFKRVTPSFVKKAGHRLLLRQKLLYRPCGLLSD